MVRRIVRLVNLLEYQFIFENIETNVPSRSQQYQVSRNWQQYLPPETKVVLSRFGLSSYLMIIPLLFPGCLIRVVL